ncbi:hypothetical protein N2152v2_000672 [Parachlorella kessleri]
MQEAKGWRGRARQDKLFGHVAGVRCMSLHPASNLLFTGSLDRTVRAWDLLSGVQLAVSRPHNGTVRCLAADDSLLVSGSSDHHIRASPLGAAAGAAGETDWHSRAASGAKACLAQRTVLPGGHSGPVTALELTPDALFSGSWDYSVRVWSRSRLRCTAAVHVDDWVSSLAAPGRDTLYVGCGKEVLLFNAGKGGLQQAQAPLKPGDQALVTAVRGSLDGRYAYFGTGEGTVVGADLRCPAQQGQHVLLRDPSGVSGLSWEYPCLAASFQRGQVALLDAEVAMAYRWQGIGGKGSQGAGGKPPKPWVRWLAGSAGGEPASCVALGEMWAAAGFDSGTVATWDFNRALEEQRAATTLRQRKQQRRIAKAARVPQGSRHDK